MLSLCALFTFSTCSRCLSHLKVIQADTPDSESMIPLKPGGLQEEEKYTDSGNYSEPVYETIPPYSIPANFPDVKVSVL